MTLLAEKISFLEKVVPEMYWMTYKAKRKIANSFLEKSYKPNQVIITEGD